ncbi:sortase domain-containing protein [Pasteuria penetrans]|uniref:sortase domain-containing protein n=1 Tax=Pasteuria penetrans TaxID=86005 RepID=UPI000F92B2F0|nr:sortase [Pasteuria penetrans]
MIRFAERIAWFVVLGGIATASYFGYKLWSESQSAGSETESYTSNTIDWNDTAPRPALKNNENKKEFIKNIRVKYKKCQKIFEMRVPRLSPTFAYSIRYIPETRDSGGVEKECLKKGTILLNRPGTVLPGDRGIAILSGHNDTHLSKFQQFVADSTRKKDEPKVTLKKPGEYVILSNHEIQYIYQMRSLRIVPGDADVVKEYKGKESKLYITTCYPFDFIASTAPYRAIFELDLVGKEPVVRSRKSG